MNRTSLFIIRISVNIKFTAKIKDILFFKYTPIIIPVTQAIEIITSGLLIFPPVIIPIIL